MLSILIVVASLVLIRLAVRLIPGRYVIDLRERSVVLWEAYTFICDPIGWIVFKIYYRLRK